MDGSSCYSFANRQIFYRAMIVLSIVRTIPSQDLRPSVRLTVCHTDMDVGPFSVIQPNPTPVANGPNPTQPTKQACRTTQPNPLRKIEAIKTTHSGQWSTKTRPQIFVKYLCKYLSILIILGMILQQTAMIY